MRPRTRLLPASDSTPADVALGFSLAAVITWLAGAAADELYLVMVVLAIAGMTLGVRARRFTGVRRPEPVARLPRSSSVAL